MVALKLLDATLSLAEAAPAQKQLALESEKIGLELRL
jgi:hypothetical protein